MLKEVDRGTIMERTAEIMNHLREMDAMMKETFAMVEALHEDYPDLIPEEEERDTAVLFLFHPGECGMIIGEKELSKQMPEILEKECPMCKIPGSGHFYYHVPDDNSCVVDDHIYLRGPVAVFKVKENEEGRAFENPAPYEFHLVNDYFKNRTVEKQTSNGGKITLFQVD